jgi:hypothetical protein
VPEQVNSEHRKLYISYCTVKTRVITSRITYLLTRIKPAGEPLPCSRYTLLRTRGVGRWVVWGVSTNIDLFVPNFCTHIIYIYSNSYLQFQASRTCISCPVASKSREQQPRIQPRSFPRSLPHLGILGAKLIETRTQLKNLKTRLLVYPIVINYIHIINIHIWKQFPEFLGYRGQ